MKDKNVVYLMYKKRQETREHHAASNKGGGMYVSNQEIHTTVLYNMPFI